MSVAEISLGLYAPAFVFSRELQTVLSQSWIVLHTGYVSLQQNVVSNMIGSIF